MAKNELTSSGWLDLKALASTLNNDQRMQVLAIFDASIGQPQVKSTPVFLVREPGKDGQVTDIGFVHHEFETNTARVSDSGRVRINIRPSKKDQAADVATPTMQPTARRAA